MIYGAIPKSSSSFLVLAGSEEEIFGKGLYAMPLALNTFLLWTTIKGNLAALYKGGEITQRMYQTAPFWKIRTIPWRGVAKSV